MNSPLNALIARRLKILGHPVRIRLLERLRDAPAAVHELVAAVGGTQQNISERLLIHQGKSSRAKSTEGA